MNPSKEIKNNIQQLSLLIRRVYGLKEKQSLSFHNHPDIITDVLKDFSNISYNLSISDFVTSEIEKEFLLYTLKTIFFPTHNFKPKFLETIKNQILKFETQNPEIDSPIYIIEKAKEFDQLNKTEIAKDLKKRVIQYATDFTLIDGFESAREFEVIETFKLWVND